MDIDDIGIDDRITLHKLQVLELVVELGGVGRAADRLHVAQPVVSAHLRSLEERLGARLFYREGRQLHLTQAGQAAHLWARDVRRRTRELWRELEGVSGGTSGSVVLGAGMSIGSYELPPILAAFRKRRPAVKIRLELPGAHLAMIDTESGENDFSVMVLTQQPVIQKLRSELIGESDMVFVAPPEGLEYAEEMTVEQLQELPFVDPTPRLFRRGYVDNRLARLGVRHRDTAMELGHPEAIKRAVMSGVGAALLFRAAVQHELDAGLLREIRIPGARVTGPIHLVCRKDKIFSPIQQELMDLIRLHYGGLTAARSDGARQETWHAEHDAPHAEDDDDRDVVAEQR